jgi:Zn ribbon nucleic-acid-binding protein
VVTMAASPAFCPHCQIPSPKLMDMSRECSVDYYRCESCSHVWTVDRVTGQFIQHVTVERTPVRLRRPPNL